MPTVRQFSSTYGSYPTDLLILAYAEGADRIRRASSGLTESEMRARARGPTRSSIHEILMHLADSELQGAFRIRKTWAETHSEWPVHDQDVWCAEHNYAGSSADDRERAVALFALVREHVVPIFRRAAPADWDRSGMHPELGVMTLRNLLELYADHSERHLEQILDTRARLGKPHAMPMLLTRRLLPRTSQANGRRKNA